MLAVSEIRPTHLKLVSTIFVSFRYILLQAELRKFDKS